VVTAARDDLGITEMERILVLSLLRQLKALEACRRTPGCWAMRCARRFG
jgi:hypothetical protein